MGNLVWFYLLILLMNTIIYEIIVIYKADILKAKKFVIYTQYTNNINAIYQQYTLIDITRIYNYILLTASKNVFIRVEYIHLLLHYCLGTRQSLYY